MKKGFMTVKELYERTEELGLENLIVNLDALGTEEELKRVEPTKTFNIGELISERITGRFRMVEPPISKRAPAYTKHKDCVIRVSEIGGKIIAVWDKAPRRKDEESLVKLYGMVCEAEWSKIRG